MSAPAGRRRAPGPWRHARLVVASAAAALVIVVGAGVAAGVVHIDLSGHSPNAALTAVDGCNRLQQADGTLQQVNGTSLVIETPNGSVTATTTTSTFTSMAGSLLAHITNGTNVRVRGNTNHGTVQATLITVGQPIAAVNPPGLAPLQGTVSDVNATGFTLATSTGPVDVTTSTNTLVVLLHTSPSQLPIGTPVFVLGSPGPDGTLVAKAVAAVAQLPTGNLHINVSVKNCSANSVLEALGTVSRLIPNT